MIKLFVLDLDGCVTMPFETPDWKPATEVRELSDASKTDPSIPPITICSGRPMPYIEAVAQWLGVRFPFIFESGGGMYNPQTNELFWADAFDEKARTHVDEIRKWFESDLLKKFPGTIIEFSKRTDAGLISHNESLTPEIYRTVKKRVEDKYPEFEVHMTPISVNVILKKANKGTGLKWLSEKTGITLDQIAYIGDSSGDLPAMKEARLAFAPANAADVVKKSSLEITHLEESATDAVAEAYRIIIGMNRENG